MSRRSVSIAHTGALLLLRDPTPVVVTVLLPLLLAPFLIPAARAQLELAGVAGANGSEQVVPGVAVLFAFMGTQLVGSLFFREHAWGTWTRLRVSGISAADLMVGKVVPLYVAQLAQLAVLFTAGAAVLGYRVNGSVLALAVALALFTAMLCAFALMLVAVLNSMDLALVLGNLGGMVMAGLGGAFTPVSALPPWAQTVAHADPAYWVLDALRRITLEHAGLGDVQRALAVVLGFGVAFAAVAIWRFSPQTVKSGTT